MKSDRERQRSYDITRIWNLILKNKDTNELINKTETDLQILRKSLWLPKGKHGGGEINQELGTNTHTILCSMYKIENQQGPTV